MLSEAEIATYHEKGYVVPEYRLPDDTLERIREEHGRLLAKHPEFRDNCSALLHFDLGFLNYARDPKILDMAAQLIGPDICLWNMSFFAKPAHNGKKTTYHHGACRYPATAFLSRAAGDAPGATDPRPTPYTCQATTKKGRPCGNAPQKGEQFCGPHLTQLAARAAQGDAADPRSGSGPDGTRAT